MFTNADFSDGTTNWNLNTASYGTAAVSGQSVIYTATTTQTTARWVFMSTGTNSTVTTDHIYYVSVKTRKTKGSASDMYLHFAGAVSSTISVSNNWVKFSRRGSYTSTSAPMYLYAKFTSGDVIEVTEPRKYDLTAMYGAGNEPTQEWCDTNLIY